MDKEFICSLIDDDRGFSIALDNKINEKILLTPYNEMFTFIREHYNRYGKTPSQPLIEERFGHFYKKPQETTLFYCDEIKNRAKLSEAQYMARSIFETIKHATTPKDKKQALETIEKSIYKSCAKFSLDYSQAQMKDITLEALYRFTEYEARKDKDNIEANGIPTPWEPLNYEILGWQNGDLNTILGKSGIGKTWALLYSLIHAHSLGKSALLFTEEMTIKQLAYRFDAMMSGLPYNLLKHSTLSPAQEEEYKDYLKVLEDQALDEDRVPFLISQGVGVQGVEVILPIIRSVQPDIVGIDGAYLLSESYDVKAISKVSKVLKQAAMISNIPIIITNQTSTSKQSMTGVAFSSAFKNDSSVMFEVRRDPDRIMLPFMEFWVKKVRDGSNPILKWTTNWDFERMDFTYRPDLDDLGEIDIDE